MYKKSIILALAFLVVAFVSHPVMSQKIPSGPAGHSHMGHLYLFEKNPSNWEIIQGGAWGKMTYNLCGPTFDFVFNGHKLTKGSEYTLIYYPDPWPGKGLICLGKGMADGEGEVHIMNHVNTGDLPKPFDANFPKGAKIWLVLSSDVNCDSAMMVGWNPTKYLFEHNLITYMVKCEEREHHDMDDTLRHHDQDDTLDHHDDEGDDSLHHHDDFGHSGQDGKSNTAHLYLFEKNPDNWQIVQGGAWGKMKFDLCGPMFDFVFNGHKLNPGSHYNLIYYPDPWPGKGLICLGKGMADEFGDVHIKNKVNTGDLPRPFDANFPKGAKIWLVLSSDVDCDSAMMIAWNPTKYLFEHNLITYTVKCEEREHHDQDDSLRHHDHDKDHGRLILRGPNPFNPTTQFSFYLSEGGQVELNVYNIAGQKVATLVQGFQEAGEHTITWTANDLSSGVYFVRLSTPLGSDVRKVTLLK